MPKAIRIYKHGGPEMMRWEDAPLGEPGVGEVVVRHAAIGLNFIDVYDRTGLYPLQLPSGLGREAAGVVEAVGRKVRGLKRGDRVAYTYPVPGAYSQLRLCPAERLVKVPAGISDEQAAAMMLKGLTARYLLRQTYRVKRGDAVLIHSAAGGVGSIAAQWARHLGAKVIGVVGNAEKAKLAKRDGCHHVIIGGPDELSARVKSLTQGAGVNVVYDSVGKDTFFASLDSLRPLGMMVTFGNSSGAVPPVSPLELAKRGSLFLTRPSLFNYVATRPALESAARDLFNVVKRGAVKIRIGQSYPLEDVATAHRDLEARRTTGSTVLIP
ncbi:MAG TPA: quinone oxidoreductase [Steroidobacteraceae bacterium]|nr:quinone oxidoreductase [Steroidobacteraceae bacterium]